MKPKIANCFIRDNDCPGNCPGAGVMVYGGTPTFENCIIENNTTESGQGGGLYMEGAGTVQFTSTIIRNNTAAYEGGGIFSSAKFVLVNSYLLNNFCEKGSAIFSTGLPSITNSTIYENQSTSSSKLIYLSNTDIEIFNSILWSSSSGLEFDQSSGNYIHAYNSIISGSNTLIGDNNKTTDPLFNVATLKFDNTSPAIGAGTASESINGNAYTVPSNDYFGTSRPLPAGTNPDIGAYEDSLGTPFVDTTAPTVTFSPTNGATDVSVNSKITITFNEAVRNIDDSNLSDTNVDGLITLKENNDSGADISFDATINDEKTIITIDPVNSFIGGQVVYITIGASVEDYSDNATAAVSAIFSTIDNVAPAVTITPSDGATGVVVDANITIGFNEPVRKLNDAEISNTNVDGLIVLKNTSSNGSNISFDATINDDKTVITVDPTNNFSKGQIVYVRIDAFVEDSYDNAIATISSIFTVKENQRPIAGKIRDGLLIEDIDLFTSTTSISANWDAFVDDGTS
ncbi:MAG: Ig-like domain-containing protein, partial [Candidatus Marinimicrobia bacterium]|nr:Ig-like domain-containing protein [Candidatus Neomarinimicrobiota bacterium]